LVAITLPPLLVLALDVVYRRTGKHPAVAGFVRGLGLAVVGIFLVVLGRLLQSTGVGAGTLLIVAASLTLGLMPRVPVLGVLASAALLGILIG
ncbi:MAG TPA: chromate transporter, partial [Herpetosiphonaceae bacterium]|nr:chromate transporter [Herpetosiphonaceae bacterium]